MTAGQDDPLAAVDAHYRRDARRVFATLVRLLGSFDLAEEALHDGFLAATAQWPVQGVPANPVAWLVSAGRFQVQHRLNGFGINVGQIHTRDTRCDGSAHHVRAVVVKFMGIEMGVGIDQ